MPSFTDWPIWLNLVVFAISCVAVWRAGTRLAAHVDGIAAQTEIGHGFAGMLLLGGITSLPEIATVVTASATGNAPLAINNLLGSASINVLLLAVADAVLGRDALTSVLAKPATLLQGTLGIILFSAVAAAILGGDVAIPILNIGIGSIVLLILCLGAMWLSAGYERRHVWTVVEEPEEEPDGDEDEEAHTPVKKLIVRTVIVGFVILVSGFLLAQTGDAIAEQSGIGASFVGLILVGFATSLPELSTVVAALKRQRYEMAVGDIFGTNLFNIALIFLADAAFRGGPILRLAGPFEAVAAMIALALTGIFIIGLLERRDRTVFRMGYDSLAAIVVFAGGMLVLYRIAPAG